MAITIVIVLRTIPEWQIFTFPIVLAIVLTPQFLWFKIQCPFNFYVNSWVVGKLEVPVKNKNCQAYLVCSLFFHPLRCPVDLASSLS